MTPEQLVKCEKHRMLVEIISGILGGHGPDIQCSVLADLVAMWVAGHQPVNGTGGEIEREGLIAFFVSGMRKLIPINDAIVKDKMMEEAKGETRQ